MKCGTTYVQRKDGVTYYPWIVQVKTTRNNGSYSCLGSIVASRYVLTAAHCVDRVDPENPHDKVEVFVGYKSDKFRFRKESVEKFIMKEDYDGDTEDDDLDYNDVALLKLKEHVDLHLYTPICLPEKEDDVDLVNKTAKKHTYFYTNDRKYLRGIDHTIIEDLEHTLLIQPHGKKVFYNNILISNNLNSFYEHYHYDFNIDVIHIF